MSEEDRRLAAQIITQFGGGYEVSHTTPFWVIDRSGRRRAILDAYASPEDIATDARILIREKQKAPRSIRHPRQEVSAASAEGSESLSGATICGSRKKTVLNRCWAVRISSLSSRT